MDTHRKMSPGEQRKYIAQLERGWGTEAHHDSFNNDVSSHMAYMCGNRILAAHLEHESKVDEYWAARRRAEANRILKK